MAQNREKPVLAIDLGGTKILAALVAPDGKVIAKERYPTLAHEGLEPVISRLFTAIESILKSKNITPAQLGAISIAAAGPIDIARGIVTASPNLPGWRNVPLRQRLEDRFGTKTFLVHDATAGAFGEYRFGAGKGAQNMVYVAVGTGIGGGIIIHGKIYDGVVGSAGEIGHMTIDIDGPKCPCGNTGCLEMLASGTAIARMARERLAAGEKSALTKLPPADITAEKIDRAARDGDGFAGDVVRQAAVYLGIGLINLVNILNPDTIVVGGSVSRLGEPWLKVARQVVEERAFPVAFESVRIVLGRLGDEAAALGAAAFAFEHQP